MQCILDLTRAKARAAFARLPNADDLVDDAVSRAWEIAQKGRGSPLTVAMFAIRHVLAGKHFSRDMQGKTSIDHVAKRCPIDSPHLRHLSTNDGDPAEQAATNLDFDTWLQGLPAQRRQIVKLLMAGSTHADIASVLGCKHQNVQEITMRMLPGFLAHFGLEGVRLSRTHRSSARRTSA